MAPQHVAYQTSKRSPKEPTLPVSKPTLIQTDILADLRNSTKALEAVLLDGNDLDEAQRERIRTRALKAIARGVLMSIDNYYQCPALRFYSQFARWLLPIAFGLILIGLIGGVLGFQQLGGVIPAP